LVKKKGGTKGGEDNRARNIAKKLIERTARLHKKHKGSKASRPSRKTAFKGE